MHKFSENDMNDALNKALHDRPKLLAQLSPERKHECFTNAAEALAAPAPDTHRSR